MITDTAGSIAVAGVMGGAETEVSDSTDTILLEAANFDFLSIRRTSQMLGLRSEAGSRFGKRVDPELTVKALARACELLEQVAGGKTRPVYGDNYPGKRVGPKQIELDPSYANRLLGIDLPAAEMVRILEALEFTVDRSGACLSVGVPTHRQDVSIPADLVEEIGRIYGYDRLPPTLLQDELPRTQRNLRLEGEEKVRDILVGCGLDEVITYSMIDVRDEVKLGLPATPHVTVLNPLTVERSHLQGHPAALAHRDLRGQPALRRASRHLRGRPCVPAAAGTGTAGRAASRRGPAGRPARRRYVAEARCAADGFFELKGVLEALIERLGLTNVVWERPPLEALHPAMHPGRTARVLVSGVEVGLIGELHPQVRAAFDLPNLPVTAMELDLDALLAGWGAKQEMAAFSSHPAVYEDLALIVDEAVPAAQVAGLIRQSGGKLLVDVRLFDVYRGGQVPPGKKSLAYSLTFQAPDRTLDGRGHGEGPAEDRRPAGAGGGRDPPRLGSACPLCNRDEGAPICMR